MAETAGRAGIAVSPQPRTVSADSRAITIDGQRTLLLSGAIHYPRSTPAMWPLLLERSREAGLNTIETYVFWNLHERQRGIYDFSDRLDLLHFCQLARDAGLNMILRIGPYICAETNYGGFPPWLRDVPGLRTRTENEPFQREMEHWVRFLTDYTRPMLAPNGGPIILVQLENEYNNVARNYGQAGQRYLQWTADLASDLGLNVPLIMCVGAAEDAIETINGFYGHKAIQELASRRPQQPLIWTENWPGWYDVYGVPHHIRTPENVAYGVARFVAEGGTGVNYYMWHGGTNFGRESMYLQTTSYDFNAPLDEYGLPTTKSRHLARLHRLLSQYADTILAQRPDTHRLGDEQHAYIYGDGAAALAFLCNDDAQTAATVTYAGRSYSLPPRAVLVVQGSEAIFDATRIDPADGIARAMQPGAASLTPFVAWEEPLPDAWPAELTEFVPKVEYSQPVEQLGLTHDTSDYCWYSAKLIIPATAADTGNNTGTLTMRGVADVMHVFVDGQFTATSQTPIEDRGPLDSEHFTQSFALDLTPGEHELALLCCALGLIKGDWMLGNANMADERKGIWGDVSWNGALVSGPWTLRPGLAGEHAAVYAAGGALAQWASGPYGQGRRNRPLTWWRAEFKRPAGLDGGSGLALDLGGMTKGLAWLNGRCIGRYWLAAATGQSEHMLVDAVHDVGAGEPTQRYYHLPLEWLRDDNVIVLFEEVGGDPESVRICSWS